MKKYLRFFNITCVMLVFISGTALLSENDLAANNSGAPAMRTGSPGDTKSCTTCHTGTAQNVSGIISSNVPATGYVPGSVYIIQAVCVDASKTRFGFEISPQNISGSRLGVITVTDVARTKLIGSGKYITHTSAGTTGSGTISWSFNWMAPPAGTGDVTFYGAFNYSNHNNAVSGDVIRLSQLTISENIFTGIEPISGSEGISIYPNPVADIAKISSDGISCIRLVQVFNTRGDLVNTILNETFSKELSINVSMLAAGTYYVSFATEYGNYFRKLVKL